MNSNGCSSRRAVVGVILLLMVGWPVPRAFGDTLGTGSFTIDIDLNTAFTITGTVTFHDSPRTPFGVNVNLGTEVGTASVTGQLTGFNPTTPVSGSVVDHVVSIADGGASLTYDSSGSFVCAPSGCASGIGDFGSFVLPITSISGSVYNKLPPGLVYTSDGAASCCIGTACVPAVPLNIQRCVGPFTLNAFESNNTPPSPTPETVPISGTFFDPLSGTLRDFDIDVGYQQVTVGGTTTVTGISNAPGTPPPNIAIQVGGFAALFFDVSTTAVAVGDITICGHYTDANSDGVVDGTTIHATALRILHQEGNRLVDRTSQVDTVNKKICATVSSLSPFAMAVTIVGYVPPDTASLACENVATKGVADLAVSIIRCNAKAASKTGTVGAACLPAAQADFNQVSQALTGIGCTADAPCVLANLTGVGSTIQAAADGAARQLFCAGPDAAAIKCEALAAKNVVKLAQTIGTCDARAAGAAVAGTTKKIASECENTAQLKYAAANGKLTTRGCAQTAPCMMANLDAIHDQLQGALEGTAVRVYCDAADPPVPFGF